jgi:hypothetical protein
MVCWLTKTAHKVSSLHIGFSKNQQPNEAYCINLSANVFIIFFFQSGIMIFVF